MKISILGLIISCLFFSSCSLSKKGDGPLEKSELVDVSEFEEDEQLELSEKEAVTDNDPVWGTGVEMDGDLAEVSPGPQNVSSTNVKENVVEKAPEKIVDVERTDLEALEASTEVIKFQGEELLQEVPPSGPAQAKAPEQARHEMPIMTYKGEEFETYKVGKNETLMSMAFKIYGDYRMWEELLKWNAENLKGQDSALKVGTIIKYRPPQKEFIWRPQGLPYLIKSGDTLGLISHKVYGTNKKWKIIWDNNRPLIIDPNLIFAGFTIYYKELEKTLTSL